MKKILSAALIILLTAALTTLLVAGVSAETYSDGNPSEIQAALRFKISDGIAVINQGSNTFLFGVTPETLVSDVTDKGCTVKNSDDSLALSGAFISTGMSVSKSLETAQVVIFGDTDKNGIVNGLDVAEMKKNLLTQAVVSDAVAKSEDALQDGVLNMADLVHISKHLASGSAALQTPLLINSGFASNDGWSDFN